jgi:hypothetical protein
VSGDGIPHNLADSQKAGIRDNSGSSFRSGVSAL